MTPPEQLQTIYIQSVEKDDERFENFLKLFIILHNKTRHKPIDLEQVEKGVKSLSALLQTLKIDEFDQYLLSILYEKMEDNVYNQIRNKAHYLEKFCLDEFKLQNKELLDVASRLAYKMLVDTFYSDYSDPKLNRPKILEITSKDRDQQYDNDKKYWSFIIENKVIRDFLASWYIVNSIDKAGSGKGLSSEMKSFIDDDLFGYDFPRSINVYARDLIIICRNDGNNFVKGIRNILKYIQEKKHLSQTMNILCYFLGRCPQTTDIIPILNDIKGKVFPKIENIDKSNLLKDDRVNLKTQYRTIAVSYMRASSNDDISKEFLIKLLSDSEMASIDRGYHRIYYGDDHPYKDKIPNCYLDNKLKDTGWTNSFSAIRSGIAKELERAKEHDLINYKAQHLVFTLTSFVQSRFIYKLIYQLTGSLPYIFLTDEQINYTKDIIDEFLKIDGSLEKGKGLLEELKQYLYSIKHDIENNNTPWNFIIDLYELKWMPRNGWLKRELQENFHYGRIESVANHTLFTVYLAHLLLPRNIDSSDYSGYNKGKDSGHIKSS